MAYTTLVLIYKNIEVPIIEMKRKNSTKLAQMVNNPISFLVKEIKNDDNVQKLKVSTGTLKNRQIDGKKALHIPKTSLNDLKLAM